MIRVQTAPFDPHAETAAFAQGRGEAGALASFVGTVRDSVPSNQAMGGEVQALELEAYLGFTEKQIAQIEADARAHFDVIDTLVIHRYGRMLPGEAIVLVAALSRHRREALQAVDYLMDRLKTEAPFWKKEVRPEGVEWIEPRADDRKAHARWTTTPVGVKRKTTIVALEVRAGELADSGQFSDWVDIADALASEGHLNSAGRLKEVPGLLDLLDQRCVQARKQRK